MRDTLSDRLDLLVDDFAGEQGDWSRVLADSGYRERAAGSAGRLGRLRVSNPFALGGRRAVRVALAAAALGGAALIAVSVVPSGGGCSGVLQCASAAVAGEGPVVHLSAQFPDVSGAPGLETEETWYDAQTGRAYSRYSAQGTSWETWSGPGGWLARDDDGSIRTMSDKPTDIAETSETGPVVKSFGSYEAALRDGSAKLAGEEVFEGQKVYAIILPFQETTSPVTGKTGRVNVRVLVTQDSYQPIAVAIAAGPDNHPIPWMHPKTFEPLFTYVHLTSVRYESRDPALFSPPAPTQK